MINETKTIVGVHGRYQAYLYQNQAMVNLLLNVKDDSSIWTVVPSCFADWTANAILMVLCWENGTEVYNVSFDSDREKAWKSAKQAGKVLSFSPLYHEYLYEGNWIVATLRPKARA